MTQSDQFTFYGGGHRGTEAEFGRQAEQFGIREVNYSFEGHQPARAKGIVILSPEELKKGDISMEIVSIRMNRTYSEIDKIRKVFQSIFHMVNSGLQVFTVGWIQPDDTVKGGTGWAAELAKLFNRPLSVFDQERNQWYTWKDNTWVEDLPKVEHTTFVGTGTRNLTETGRQAIKDLFTRSFA
ncbi:MAG: hypothetical protein VR64_11880 [Desulfatitalea sp. BRH_c12]|nr:MAG: hypothetical protein VR64_11880 [Desulfatitalea sp. BRH_c12]